MARITVALVVRPVDSSESDGLPLHLLNEVSRLCMFSAVPPLLTRDQPMRLNQPSLKKTNTQFDVLIPKADFAAARFGSQGPVLLLGAPGAGKGTQADALADFWQVPKISTGDILRANVAGRTKLGTRAKKVMKTGGLVPDEVMMEMVATRLARPDAEHGFILDGFPRTIRQAEWFDEYLSADRRGAQLGIVSMSVDFEQLVKRVIHRRICPLCKAVYNEELMPPKRVGICDNDGSVLEQRNDDKPEVFKTRLDVFRRETEPLIQFYRDHDLFISIDAQAPPAAVTKAIVSGLTARREQAQVKRMQLYSSLAS